MKRKVSSYVDEWIMTYWLRVGNPGSPDSPGSIIGSLKSR